MRKLLLPLLLGALCISCTDKNYDLTKVDTENTTLGNEFRIPLATIHIGMSQLGHNNSNIEKIFEQADIWLPKQLPDNSEFLDLTRMQDIPYINRLVDALIAEMKSSTEKLDEVTDEICRDYKNAFLSALGLPVNVSDEVFKEVFKREFPRQPLVQDQARKVASDYLNDIRIENIKLAIDGVDIASDVVDMLTDNLDPKEALNPRSTLHLYGQIESRLPVSMRIEPSFLPTQLRFTVDIDAAKSVNPIAEANSTRLFREELLQFVEGIRVDIPIELEKYYPKMGFKPDEQDQLLIRLRLVKRGGLKL